MTNVDYNKKCIEIISSLEHKPTLLLHSCCGPCSTAVIARLKQYFDITIYYYNPNIEPYDEYVHRRDEQIRLLNVDEYKLPYMIGDYDNDRYRECTIALSHEPEGGARCKVCYSLRLDSTAKLAGEKHFDYFCTTLTVSPSKDANIINPIGYDLQDKYGVKWLPSNFKKNDGYLDSIRRAKEQNLYRQHYCGCSYTNNQDK